MPPSLIRQAHYISLLAGGSPWKRAAVKACIPQDIAPDIARAHGSNMAEWADAAQAFENLLAGQPAATPTGRRPKPKPSPTPAPVVKVVEVPGPVQVVEVPGPVQVVEVPGPVQVVEKHIEVPVEIATRYLDHPSPLVEGLAHCIGYLYRRMSSLVRQWDEEHPDEIFDPFDPFAQEAS